MRLHPGVTGRMHQCCGWPARRREGRRYTDPAPLFSSLEWSGSAAQERRLPNFSSCRAPDLPSPCKKNRQTGWQRVCPGSRIREWQGRRRQGCRSWRLVEGQYSWRRRWMVSHRGLIADLVTDPPCRQWGAVTTLSICEQTSGAQARSVRKNSRKVSKSAARYLPCGTHGSVPSPTRRLMNSMKGKFK